MSACTSDSALPLQVVRRIRRLPADIFTPVSLLLALRQVSSAPLFLFESCGPDLHQARYSFLGLDPVELLYLEAGALMRTSKAPDGSLQSECLTRSQPLQALAAHLPQFNVEPESDLPPFTGGYVGYLGYDCVQYLEKIHLPPQLLVPDEPALPEACLMRCEDLIVFDHLKNSLLLITNLFVDPAAPLSPEQQAQAEASLDRLQALIYASHQLQTPLPPLPTPQELAQQGTQLEGQLGEAAFLAAVAQIQAAIVAGETFQTVLSERFVQPLQVEPVDVYRVLRSLSPAPYLFYLDWGSVGHQRSQVLLGASPEMLLRVQQRHLTTCPIAGTRPRGQTPQQDQAYAQEMLGCDKERAEHLMLVDLGRNDLGRVAQPGSVRVSQFMEVERYSHVMHLVSRVEAELDAQYTAFEALLACFPAGTLSGAPKVRAMELIAELEPQRRGWYGGCVFYHGFDGNLDSAITIRSLSVAHGQVSLQAGAGIVADSVPAHEYKEVQNKARALFQALAHLAPPATHLATPHLDTHLAQTTAEASHALAH